MLSASKITFSLNVLKISRPKVTKNLTNLLKKFCEFPPRSPPTLEKKSTHPVVNFINILRTCFSYKSKLSSFSLVAVWLCNFLASRYKQKSTCKMLMKLTPIANFINVLRAAFALVDPESVKNTVKSSVSFNAFGIYERKSCS